MNLDELAEAAGELAARAREGLALAAVRPAAREYLAVLQQETPVKSGALRSSEVIRAIEGDGTHATAIAGPDIVYDKIRNDGGTITAKGKDNGGAEVLSNGVQFFGKSVTQRGDHYMVRARDMAGPLIESVIRGVVDEFLTL